MSGWGVSGGGMSGWGVPGGVGSMYVMAASFPGLNAAADRSFNHDGRAPEPGSGARIEQPNPALQEPTMTETTYTGPISPEDIDGADDIGSARLDDQADIILAEGALGPRPIHEAVREDAVAAREWSRARAERLRRAVEDEPMTATLYALGLGLIIGMLIAR